MEMKIVCNLFVIYWLRKSQKM